jgi:hypothetical protein
LRSAIGFAPFSSHDGGFEDLYASCHGGVNDAVKVAIATPKFLRGDDTVARFIVRVWPDSAHAQGGTEMVTRWFNGSPGILIYEAGLLSTAVSLVVDSGLIRRAYALRNPDELVTRQ